VNIVSGGCFVTKRNPRREEMLIQKNILNSQRGWGKTISEDEEVLVIRRGTKIICPKCKTVIGKFKREKSIGRIISVDDIEFYMGEFKKGDKMLCPKCGFPWGVIMIVTTSMGISITCSVHTSKGWVPPRIPSKELTKEIELFLKKKGCKVKGHGKD